MIALLIGIGVAFISGSVYGGIIGWAAFETALLFICNRGIMNQ